MLQHFTGEIVHFYNGNYKGNDGVIQGAYLKKTFTGWEMRYIVRLNGNTVMTDDGELTQPIKWTSYV